MKRQLIICGLSLLFVFTSSVTAVNMEEDFGDGFDDWEIYDEPGANTSPSSWQITSAGGHDTAFSPKSNIYGGDAGTHEPSRGTWVIYKNAVWAHASLEASMFMTDNDIPGLLFRYVDPDNFYVFDVMQQGRAIPAFKRLRKVVDGVYTDLDIVHDGGYKNDVWQVVRIEYIGKNIKVFWDDQLVLDVDDDEPALRSGQVALSSWGMTDIFFDDIKVSGSAAVDSAGKMAVVWGEIKRDL